MIPFINIHTHKAEIAATFILNAPSSGILPDVEYISYGIHPWDIDMIDIEVQLEKLQKHCLENKLVAIGEIGLDRVIETPFEIQKEVFIKQLEIAKQYQLPVILHCVKAWSDILAIRKSEKYSNHLIFHGFTGNLQIAQQIIKSGCFLSFGKALIYNKKLQEVFFLLPRESIFFETDDSELKVEEIYQKAAEIYDICMDDLKAIIWDNFNKVFNLRN
jgi:TatD DNase family protein